MVTNSYSLFWVLWNLDLYFNKISWTVVFKFRKHWPELFPLASAAGEAGHSAHSYKGNKKSRVYCSCHSQGLKYSLSCYFFLDNLCSQCLFYFHSHYSIILFLLKSFICLNNYLSSNYCVSVTILNTKVTLVMRDNHSHTELTIHEWWSGHNMLHVVLVHFPLGKITHMTIKKVESQKSMVTRQRLKRRVFSSELFRVPRWCKASHAEWSKRQSNFYFRTVFKTAF